MDGLDRLRLGRMTHPVRGLLHGTAAVVSAVGLGLLIAHAWGDSLRVVAAVVFGLSLIALYTVFSLYHSIEWTERVKARLQRADHSMIFLAVAGTTTPVAVATLSGGALVAVLAAVWGVAALGIGLKVTLRTPVTWLSVALQVLMGLSVVVWFPSILDAHGWSAGGPVAAGGLAYLIGVVVYVTQRPRLFPRVFAAHEVFHVMVVTASALHFTAVWRVLA